MNFQNIRDDFNQQVKEQTEALEAEQMRQHLAEELDRQDKMHTRTRSVLMFWTMLSWLRKLPGGVEYGNAWSSLEQGKKSWHFLLKQGSKIYMFVLNRVRVSLSWPNPLPKFPSSTVSRRTSDSSLAEAWFAWFQGVATCTRPIQTNPKNYGDLIWFSWYWRQALTYSEAGVFIVPLPPFLWLQQSSWWLKVFATT